MPIPRETGPGRSVQRVIDGALRRIDAGTWCGARRLEVTTPGMPRRDQVADTIGVAERAVTLQELRKPVANAVVSGPEQPSQSREVLVEPRRPIVCPLPVFAAHVCRRVGHEQVEN